MVKTARQITLALVASLFIAVGILASFSTTYAKSSIPAYSAPYWWSGNCDSGHNSNANPVPMYTWNGIQVCKPLAGKTNMFPVAFPNSQENEFQCTELVKRFIYAEYPNLKTLGGTNGSQLVANYTDPSQQPGTPFHAITNNGSVQMIPQAGDILSYGPTAQNSAGHTSIVISSNSSSITVIQQNALWSGSYLPTETLSLSGYTINPSTHGLGSITSWMTTRSIPNPATYIQFSIKLSGIGLNSGDNSHPVHTGRLVAIQLRNGNNQNVATWSQTIFYNSSTGLYSGVASTTAVPYGQYLFEVKMSNALNTQGSYIVSGGTTTNEQTISPRTGDVDGNNVKDILDYNDLMSCYGSKFVTCGFNPSADLNDDGQVNGTDYNMWLRS